MTLPLFFANFGRQWKVALSHSIFGLLEVYIKYFNAHFSS